MQLIDFQEQDSQSKGRKDIRKIKSDKKLTQETKEAATVEKDRRKRMEEKQQLYNQQFKVKEGDTLKELPLDFDPTTKKVLVEVDKRIVKKLKPHQAEGVKFMWDAVFESKKVKHFMTHRLETLKVHAYRSILGCFVRQSTWWRHLGPLYGFGQNTPNHHLGPHGHVSL